MSFVWFFCDDLRSYSSKNSQLQNNIEILGPEIRNLFVLKRKNLDGKERNFKYLELIQVSYEMKNMSSNCK